MSRLIDKLNRVSKAMPQPMGFRTDHPTSPKSQMLLIASLTETENVDSLADYVAGADAVLVHITKSSSGAKALQKIAQSLPDIPWGGWLGDIGEKRMETTLEVGCDFVVFPTASTVLAISQDDKVGKILQVESSLSEGLLKAVNELPVDAVLATTEEERDSLTWHHLMLSQRFASLLTKPLLVSVPPNVTANEIKALWEVGVDGVVVEVSPGQPIRRLEELRRAIGDLTFLTPRKRGKAEALLPYIREETGTATDIEEEEE